MSALALFLVLTSALLHATWNLLAKRVGRGAPLVWLFATTATVILLPLAVFAYLHERPELGPAALALIAASGVLHLAYMLALQRGYRAGDMSLVYPLARGSGPVLAVLAAVLLFDERPGPVALAGAGLVALGAFLLAGAGSPAARVRAMVPAVGYGLLTGIFIASYTLTDAHGVANLGIPPLILLWSTELIRSILLAPVAFRRSEEVRFIWAEHRGTVLAVAVLSPLAYLLVLGALIVTPVSYVAPVRELSILFGAVLGTSLLAEDGGRHRIVAAAAMVVGVAALAMG